MEVDNSIEYIDDIKRLRTVCNYIKKNVDVVGIDTEFIRRNTYYPELCLMQVIYFDTIQNSYRIAVVDVCKIKDIRVFLPILNKRTIKKIFFSCGQDLDSFVFLMNKSAKNIKNIDDLQVMMEFCGYDANIGYADCVKKVLGVPLKKDKQLQISNWKKRPLTKKQIMYASNDVVYLIKVYEALYKIITGNRNYEYYLDEMKHIIKSKSVDDLVENSWKKIKFNLHKKNIGYVILLKELCKWREKKAIELNKTRLSIVNDSVLEEIADNKPKNTSELKMLYMDNFNLLNLKKEYKTEILDIVNSFVSGYGSLYKNGVYYVYEKGFPYRSTLDRIYNEIKNISAKCNINVSRFINRAEIISLMMKYERKKQVLYGWKKKLLGQFFLKTVDNTI
ncbi:MAG: HRDC domain-containing protein [Rickettsiales bacterium]|nr:HRDC domain-containing protein [Rickettsiales bacterium]